MSCACGCGQPVKSGKRFIHNHHLKSAEARAMYDLRRQYPPANPDGLCQCGCGAPTPIATYTAGQRGIYKGLPLRYIRGHHLFARRGPNHSGWKGGTYITYLGYIAQYAPDHPNNHGGYVLQHRLVMESSLGRLLTDKEPIHHINGTKTDNRPENLQLTNPSDHGRHHYATSLGQWAAADTQRTSAQRSAAGKLGADRRRNRA